MLVRLLREIDVSLVVDAVAHQAVGAAQGTVLTASLIRGVGEIEHGGKFRVAVGDHDGDHVLRLHEDALVGLDVHDSLFRDVLHVINVLVGLGRAACHESGKYRHDCQASD